MTTLLFVVIQKIKTFSLTIILHGPPENLNSVWSLNLVL